MLINTVRFSHLLEEENLHDISHFLAHTAFVISHKTESMDTLAGVLWYLPVSSPIIVVTNCPQQEYGDLVRGLRAHLTSHLHIYVIHQKDAALAAFFHSHGLDSILGPDGLVRDGKGEGMYIGTLLADLLRFPRWVVFYDADNLVPCALLEYTLALGRLFLAADSTYAYHEAATLHNVRVCWASKPAVRNGQLEHTPLGRCTSVISPIFSSLLNDWFGLSEQIISSNAGEQGMTMGTARALRFSSGFSVETFQLLDLLFKATSLHALPHHILLEQYQSQSPHFHTKREDAHIKQMISASLGCFLLFQEYLSPPIEDQILRVREELGLDMTAPFVYPPLQELELTAVDRLPYRYRLFASSDSSDRDPDTLLETTIG
jgi:mannosyl-3-phosphoglycerate synthase